MNVVLDIFKTLYESLWISLVLALLFSVVCIYAKGVRLEQPGWKSLCRLMRRQFKIPQFRHSFYLYFYTAVILYQTLLGRQVWTHPFEAVFGSWSIITSYGAVNTQVVRNIFIFTPFIILLFWSYGEKIIKGNTLWSYLWPALKITGVFSFSIEVLQALLHLGTLQISDFCYNVVGGVIGGLVYWCGYRIKNRGKEENTE